jgi:MFS family permease
MSFFAASMTRAYGRKVSLVFASICFMAGTGLNAGAVNLAMLVVGRILLGFGIGAANTRCGGRGRESAGAAPACCRQDSRGGGGGGRGRCRALG